jgi:hypothetical protein
MSSIHITTEGIWMGTTQEVSLDTTAPFYVTSDGEIKASDGNIGGISITSSSIQSTNFGASNGFQLNSDGSAIFRSITISGYATTTQVNNAQSTADSAATAASNAQSTANDAESDASDAQSTADGITSNIYYSGTTEINGGRIRTGTLDAAKITSGTFATGRIPNLDTSKITSGTFATARLADEAVTIAKLPKSGDFYVSNDGQVLANGISTTGSIVFGANTSITGSPTANLGSVYSSGIGRFNSYVSAHDNYWDRYTNNNIKFDGSSAIELRPNNVRALRTTQGGSGGYVFTYDSGGSSNTLYTPYSDERLKENIVNLNIGLAEIIQLRPITYDWKDDARPYPENTELQYGLLAQEVEDVIPSIVSTSPLTIDRVEKQENEETGEMTEVTVTENLGMTIDGEFVTQIKGYEEKPLLYGLINSVKELNTLVLDLTARIETLEG